MYVAALVDDAVAAVVLLLPEQQHQHSYCYHLRPRINPLILFPGKPDRIVFNYCSNNPIIFWGEEREKHDRHTPGGPPLVLLLMK